MRAAILMTVHNRKNQTLKCLKACREQFAELKGRYDFTVYLVDDGCTDGTSDAVLEQFQDTVIIKGDGSLYWNHGMIRAWEEAAKEDFDFYIWLNDDTILLPGALNTLLENSYYLRHKAIVAGTARDSSGKLSYGGRTRKGRLIAPDDTIPIPCDTFNGNLVLVPRFAFRTLGTMDPRYSHSFGDYDYGIRADKAGVTTVIAPGVLAVCDRNPGLPKWRNRAFTLKQRYAAIMSPKGRPFKEQFLYDTRKGNIFTATVHFISLNIKVLFPKGRSAAACRATGMK